MKYLILKDIYTYFRSYLAVSFLLLFVFFINIFFFKFTSWLDLELADLTSFFIIHPYLFLFFIPVLSMQLWTEEYRQDTLEVLYSFPITVKQIVLAKFFSGVLLILIALVLTMPIYITASFLGEVDHSAIWTAYLGSFLLGLTFFAVCTLFATMSKSLVLSYLFSFFILLFLSGIGVQQLSNIFPSWISQDLIELTRYFSIEGHFLAMQKGVIDLRDIIYNLSIIIGLLFLSYSILEYKKSLLREDKKILYWSFLLVLSTIFFVNIAVKNTYLRYDFTEYKNYTLSETSIKIIQDINEPVFLEFFYDSGEEIFDSKQQAFVYRVNDLFKQLKNINKHINFASYDIARETHYKEKALLLLNHNLGKKLSIEQKYFIAINAKNKWAVIDNVIAENEDNLELEIIQSVLKVLREKEIKVATMTSLPIHGENPNLQLGNFRGKREWKFISVLRENYTIIKLPEVLERPISKDISTILMVLPRKISRLTSYYLDQFILRGGKLVLFLDPYNISEERSKTLPTIGFNLAKLLNHWGLIFENNKIISDEKLKSFLFDKEQKTILTFKDLEQKSKIFYGIKKLYFAHSGFIETIPSKNTKLNYHSLLSSNPSSELYSFETQSYEGSKGQSVLMKVSGEFTSLFKELPSTLKEGHLERIPYNEVYIFTDADFLNNHLSYDKEDNLISNNISLLENIVTDITGSKNLSPIREKISLNKSLDELVNKKAFFKKFKDKRLGEITTAIYKEQLVLEKLIKKKTNSFFLNEEEEKELRKANQNIDLFQEEVKQIYSLRDSLFVDYKNRIFLINLLLVPCLLLLVILINYLYKVLKKEKGLS